MKEQTKEWKPVVGYEGLYEVSSDGDVRNAKTGRVLKPGRGKDGYLQLCLCHLGRSRTFSIHRIVAIAFIKNPNGKEQVNHKDGVKTNNNVKNLEWSTPSENLTHAWVNGYCENTRLSASKLVVDLQTGVFYNSLVEACNATGSNYDNSKHKAISKSKTQRFQYI